MARAKHPNRLKETVKVHQPGAKMAHLVPPYKKSITPFLQGAQEGDLVTLHVRYLDHGTARYELKPVTGTLIEIAPHSIHLVDEDGHEAVAPIWAVHDWEIHS